MKSLNSSFAFLLIAIALQLGANAQQTVSASGGEATGNGQASYTVGQVAFFPLFSGTGEALQGVQVPYEYYQPNGSCTGDINLDGLINGSDLVLLLASLGAVCTDCAEDLNGDTLVNGADLVILLAVFGSACD